MTIRPLLICLVAALSFAAVPVLAGELREIELQDGSSITAEVLSLSNGVYTVRSESLGTIKLDEAKVRTIRARTASANTGTTGRVRSLQENMLGDREIMNLINSLQNDPAFKKILEDPEILKAVNAGDIAALTANPRFMDLLNHSTVKEIEKKVR